jgi:hypothetical protein
MRCVLQSGEAQLVNTLAGENVTPILTATDDLQIEPLG